MNQYAQVYETVTRLTDDPSLRAFFISYLLAENDAERTALNARFWKAIEVLETERRQQLKKAMQNSFKQLPVLANTLLERVQEAKAEHSAVAA